MTFANSMRLLAALLLLGFLVGCGDTWRGMKQDTGENLEATGDAIENSGEKVKSE